MANFLINLDRSPERLAHVDKQFNGLGIVYTRVAAIDGSRLSTAERADAGPRMSSGEVGCFLSHRLVWERIADCPEPFAAVFEDDIHLAPTLPDFLSDWGWVPHDADIVKIDTMQRSVYLDQQTIATRKGHCLSRLRSTHSGTAGYIMSARTARALSAQWPMPTRPVDALLFELPNKNPNQLAVYQIDPALCIQDELYAVGKQLFLSSIIHQERKALRRGAKRPVSRVVRETTKLAERILRLPARLHRGVVRKRIPFGRA